MARAKAKVDPVQELTNKILDSFTTDEMLEKYAKIEFIQQTPIYTEPPKSVEDSHRFGWMRGMGLMTETMVHGSWFDWLLACGKGEADPHAIKVIQINESVYRTSLCYKMLEKCMQQLYRHGYRITDFIDWLCYALGIAWAEKPRLSEAANKELYETFNLDLFYMQPGDYLSEFVAEHGQSGHLDYYPTPFNVTKMMALMTEMKPTASQLEPCIGGAAMFLASDSLIQVGMDLSHTMVKVASIQAFIYRPWLLFTPVVIQGIHFNKEEMRIDKYFEFDTDTRIYNGDSLLGEFRAPVNVFDEHSEFVDIYHGAVDLSKRKVFEYEQYFDQDWNTLSNELKMEIVKAQARELGFEVVLTNPPFNASLSAHTKQRIKDIEKSNELFLKERSMRLSVAAPSIELLEEIIYEAEIRITESKNKKIDENQLELVF